MLLRRAVIAASVSLACGPTVPIDDGGETSDGSNMMPPTTVGSATAMTASTTVSTTSMTTATTASDESTSIDPTTTGADESSSDEGPFIAKPDGAGPCVTVCSYCDLWAQDCQDDEKCVPWAAEGELEWSASRCSAIDPMPVLPGEPCVVQDYSTSGLDNCGAGAFCWDVDPVTLEGVCVELCVGPGANPTCDEGLGCYLGFFGWVNACVPPCDPLAPACADDEACMYTGQEPPFARFVCLPTPPFVASGYGEACEFGSLQLCASGLACVAPQQMPGCGDSDCCTIVGDLAAPPVCPDITQTCVPFDEEIPESDNCYCGVLPP